jgi:glycosyltransferase involved in cell wall biosynthesis
MSILFALPQWGLVSELWATRMAAALRPDLSAIACRNPPRAKWCDEVPFIDLNRRPWSERLLHRSEAGRAGTASRRMTEATNNEQVRCVLVHYAAFAVQLREALERLSKPLYIYCHGYDVTWDLRYHQLATSNMHASDYVQAVRQLSTRATFIANSRHTMGCLREIGIEDHRIVLRYFGIPAPAQPPQRPASSRSVNVLYLGRLIDFKGPDLVIKAFERACDKGMAGQLIMAGDGPLGVSCELLVRRSKYADRIKLLGAVDAETGQRLRRQADVFTAHSCKGALSGQSEAFGVAFAEAMADGLPVVTGRSGALPELVEDGVTGILFEPGDVDAHANALLVLAEDPQCRLRMGEEGWRRIRTHFPWEHERPELLRIMGLED